MGNVSAYMLQDGEAFDIMDGELGEIKAELIDSISNVINQKYDQLLQLDDSDDTED